MLRRWTIQRATGTGIVAGIAAFLAAAAIDSWPGGLLYPYALLLALTALCGASVLLITARDMRVRGTSQLMRPIRGFDIMIGLVLLLPAGYALATIWPRLGL
ncbi:hypothetical protein RCO27_09155 [Sphingosinicella sp. LHD-64]|uniref:hypothetical protein n=1 Tax=Sphingosinicella sp. LHD-64 TaxID=3072139 RepID=UPI00280CF585|nr:hypothetical protein [Sphingosinicella sp. LHD-64]MDQ8756397.1 hypothetical protein [Sphingosinicella sp. LHD-64]